MFYKAALIFCLYIIGTIIGASLDHSEKGTGIGIWYIGFITGALITLLARQIVTDNKS